MKRKNHLALDWIQIRILVLSAVLLSMNPARKIHAMVCNGQALLRASPIKHMLGTKEKSHGVSHGLSEAGYDIRVKQEIVFSRDLWGRSLTVVRDFLHFASIIDFEETEKRERGRFVLASAVEEFTMPTDLVGIVHDKSTWARRGVSVFNTVIEPGWNGFLTLEIVYHGWKELVIPANTGIAQVIFHRLECPAAYTGKYQNQQDKPVPAKRS